MSALDRNWSWWLGVSCVVGTLGGAGCVSEPELADRVPPTFEEFEAASYREPWDGGVYVINGDTPVVDRKELYEIWEELSGGGALIVHQSGGGDAKWTAADRRALRYCVSDRFGARKPLVVAAMAEAAERGWERFADVDLIYVPAEDANCTPSNPAVMFDVSSVSGQPYLARAFFPGMARGQRNINIDSTAFTQTTWPLAGVLGHELGHALGFRHEHTRPEAGVCFEDSNWRPLTPYDPGSIMHYPQCNGRGPQLTFSTRDAEGALALYGPPGGGGQPPPPPPPQVDRTANESGSLLRNDERAFGPYLVVPRTQFRATMTGTGDLDLYVRFNDAPTVTAFDCRPFLETSIEACVLDVPADAVSAAIMVRGYASGSFALEVKWRAPASTSPGLVLNEILADPPAGFDANGDGVFSTEADEFIELVNLGDAAFELGGATVSDATGLRVTLPVGTRAPAHGALLIFGGGVPRAFPPGVVALTAGPLRLNNTGDAVTVRSPSGAILASATYGAEGGRDQALVRTVDGDATSAWVLHSTRSSRPASPGTRADGSGW